MVDAPEQAVARRYRKLHRDGVVRVIGLLNPQVYGDSQWVVRVRAKPDDLPRLAEALVRRPEVTHANVLSGWTELVCIIRAPLGETQRQYPATPSANIEQCLALKSTDPAGVR